ncbi:stage II sporulation protein M [Candidatus Pacearchaeota archaeon]|nr:stage II sporulation protein M [Candidatus Pacearchaeota archaeon]
MKEKKRKNSKSFLEKNYIKSWNYLLESRNYILIILGFFMLSVLIGALIPAPEILEQQILKFIENLLSKTEGMSHLELINFIFINNLQSSFLGMIFGIFLGIFSAIVCGVNGYILGFVIARSVQISSIFVIWRLFPHGIFELPALFLSLGLGLKLGTFIFQKNKLLSLRNYLRESLRVFLFIVIPLLILAALIEGSFIFFLR